MVAIRAGYRIWFAADTISNSLYRLPFFFNFPGMCLCVCCHPIYSGSRVCRRISRGHTGGRSHRISPPSSCGACLTFSPERASAVPFPRRPWSRLFLCTNELIALPYLLGIYIYIYIYIYIEYFFFVRKNPSSCDCTYIRTHVPMSEGFEVTN